MDIKKAITEQFDNFSSEIVVNNLPSIDGILPVNRKVMYALYRNKITSKSNYIKMLRASAYSMVYYVYGDMPLTNSMKNMGNNGLNYFLLDPKGSFGNKNKINGNGASPRYIECRLSEYSEYMMKDLDSNSVEFMPNFDNTEIEPKILPSMIPNVLINSTQSIAVGYSSKMYGHNLIDSCDSIINYIKTDDIESTINILKCPDFLIGGRIIYDKNKFNNIYKNGKGSFEMVGKYRYDKKTRKFTIYEIPYETFIEKIEDSLDVLVEKKKFNEISSYKNTSGKDGISLDIYLKKDTNIELFEKKLMKMTPYKTSMSCNFTMLDLDYKTPKLMSLEDIISKWILFRRGCISKSLQYKISKNDEVLNKLYGLKTVLLDIDKAIKVVKESNNDNDTIKKLMKEFNINEIQANYVSDIKLKNLNKSYIKSKIKNIKELEKINKDADKIIKSKDKINDLIISQLEEIKIKFGRERNTEIIENLDITSVDLTEIAEDYKVNIYYTENQYINKTKNSNIGKLKDSDKILKTIHTNNKSDLFVLTNLGNAHRVPLHTINTIGNNNLGEYIPNLINLQSDEKILDIFVIDDYSKGYVLYMYRNNTDNKGKIAKIDSFAFNSKQNRSKFANCMDMNSELLAIDYIDEDVFCSFTSDNGRVIITNTESYSSKKSRSSQGVTVLKTDKNCKVINGFIDISKSYTQELFTTNGKNIICELDESFDNNRDNFEYYLSPTGSGKGNYLVNFGKNPKGYKVEKVENKLTK